MPHVKVPTPLRRFAGGATLVEVTGATVDEAMQDLVRRHPDLRRHLYGDDGKLRSFVNLYVGGEDVRFLQKERTPLSKDATVLIVPSIAGGGL